MPAQFWKSPDAEPLCSSCAHASIPWPPRFDDVQSHDRCGAGCLTMRKSQRQCFSYSGERAELVTIEFKPVAETDWQDRVDGMTVRRPKSG